MGEYLSQPDKTKHTDSGESQQLRFVAMGMQGWRRSMEDSHIANVNIGNGVSLFGVYDGHGGRLIN
jgi:protein phosphatase 1G